MMSHKVGGVIVNSTDNILIGIGCEVDNGRLWGGVIFSALFFTIFFVTGFYVLLLLGYWLILSFTPLLLQFSG